MTPVKIKQALKALPSGSGTGTIEKAYEGALHRINSQPDSQQEIARKILTWISYAQRPLSISELQHALAVEPNTLMVETCRFLRREELTLYCAGLVIIDEKSDMVRFIHYTLQEYFEMHRAVQLPDGDSMLAKSCLRYLLFDDLFKALSSSKDRRMKGSGSDADQDDMDQSKETSDDNCSDYSEYAPGQGLNNRESWDYLGYVPCKVGRDFSLVRYAVSQWHHHTYQSGENEQAVTNLVVTFLRRTQQNYRLAGLIYHYFVEVHSEGSESLDLSIEHTTPLMIASYCGLNKTCQLLLKTDALEASSRDFRTPLIYAVLGEHTTTVDLLLARGARTDSYDSDGWLPQHYAACSGNVELMSCLMRCPIVIDEHDSTHVGQTALMMACELGHESIVALLLQNGADAKIMDWRGKTAMQYAFEAHHERILDILSKTMPELGCSKSHP